ncbi:MAG: hypothetical protein ABIO99_01285 [Candidatus Limnocylindria bacterium]
MTERYRHHELALADGVKLVLRTDGSIHQLDAKGTETSSWVPDDPEWSVHALRFGLQPQTDTIKPPGRRA